MDKKIAGLLGAVASIATVAAAQAATEPASASTTTPAASSYADLLAPIQNPVEQLKADDAARVQGSQTEQLAQYYYPYQRYYHHHHHHHHHHHRGVVIGIPGVGGVQVR